MKVHWLWIGVGGWCCFIQNIIIHVGGKISAAGGYGERYRVYLMLNWEILLKFLNCCYLLIDKVFGGASSFMMAMVVMMMVLQ